MKIEFQTSFEEGAPKGVFKIHSILQYVINSNRPYILVEVMSKLRFSNF